MSTSARECTRVEAQQKYLTCKEGKKRPGDARGLARARRTDASRGTRATLYVLPSLRARPRPIAIPAASVAASTAREASYTIIAATGCFSSWELHGAE